MLHWVLLFIGFLLVLVNAFFVAAEFGMVKLRHTKLATIKNTYGFRGKILAEVHKHLDAYLSACQLGITLASLGLGWVGEPAFAQLLRPVLGEHLSPEMTALIAFIIAFTILSFLHIVIGELLPKSLAIRQSEKVSVWTAVPLYLFYWLMFPFIWCLNYCTNAILKSAKLHKVNKGDYAYTAEELRVIFSSTHVHTKLNKQELEILKHTLDFADLTVADLMRPLDEMIILNADETITGCLKEVSKYQYSRYPVYLENPNEIMGIVHVKDILAALNDQRSGETLRVIMRPVLKISHQLSALRLLNKLQGGTPHFALVYSGRETVVGFITMDNLFQVLIGRVRDEFHKTEELWTRADDGAYLVSGNCSLYVLERALDIELEWSEDDDSIDTLFGLILTELGRLPVVGEKIGFKQFDAVIKKMQGHRIMQVAIYPKVKEKKEIE